MTPSPRAARSLDDALGQALEDLEAGLTPLQVLERYPDYEAELGPLIETAYRLRTSRWPTLSLAARVAGREKMHAAIAAEKARRRSVFGSLWLQVGAGVALVVLAGTTYFASPLSPLRSTQRPTATAYVPSTVPTAPTLTVAPTPWPSATAYVVASPAPSATPEVRDTTEPTDSPERRVVATAMPEPSGTPTRRLSATATRTPSATPSATATARVEPSATGGITATPVEGKGDDHASPSPTRAATATATRTAAPSTTPSRTPGKPIVTRTPSPTADLPEPTDTETPRPSVTPSTTPRPSVTPSATTQVPPTKTNAPSATPTPTAPPDETAEPTATRRAGHTPDPTKTPRPTAGNTRAGLPQLIGPLLEGKPPREELRGIIQQWRSTPAPPLRPRGGRR